jgi:hypothetical protein
MVSSGSALPVQVEFLAIPFSCVLVAEPTVALRVVLSLLAAELLSSHGGG